MTRYDMHLNAFSDVQNSYYYVARLGYKDLFAQLQEINDELLKRMKEEEVH